MFRFAEHNKNGLFRITNRILYSGFAKAFEPQETGIAFAAGKTIRRWIVTAVGKRQIDAELYGFTDDFGFGEFDQRGVNLKASAFHAGFSSNIGDGLERFDEFRTAIRVAAVIDCIYTEKNVSGLNHFRPAKRVSQKNGVTRRNVSDWNAVCDFCFRALFRHIDVAGQRRSAKDTQVDLCDSMFPYAKRVGGAPSSLGFDLVTLTVIERQRIRFVAFGKRYGERGC